MEGAVSSRPERISESEAYSPRDFFATGMGTKCFEAGAGIV
jgi:hypothetical protein